jgi:lipopolysaccharide transport system permease protein
MEIINRSPPSPLAALKELWLARHLVRLLVRRDISLRYKQTFLGVVWAFLQPILIALMFALIFGLWVRVPSDGMPYLPFVLVGVAAWMFFAGSVQHATYSILSSATLVTKIYFPRATLPVASVGMGFTDLAITVGVLVPVLYFDGVRTDVRLIWALAAIAALVMLTLGVAFATAALSVHYRDFPHLVPFSLQLLMFASPVVYPSTIVPAEFVPWIRLNPLVGVIDLLRWSVFGGPVFPAHALTTALPVSAAALAAGWVLFTRLERGFADTI